MPTYDFGLEVYVSSGLWVLGLSLGVNLDRGKRNYNINNHVSIFHALGLDSTL